MRRNNSIPSAQPASANPLAPELLLSCPESGQLHRSMGRAQSPAVSGVSRLRSSRLRRFEERAITLPETVDRDSLLNQKPYVSVGFDMQARATNLRSLVLSCPRFMRERLADAIPLPTMFVPLYMLCIPASHTNCHTSPSNVVFGKSRTRFVCESTPKPQDGRLWNTNSFMMPSPRRQETT